MLTVVESSASADRFAAAADFIWSFPRGTELLLVGATREAIDELSFRLTAESGASFGWHRFTLLQLAAVLAQPALAERGLVHASPLGAMALVARAIRETELGRAVDTNRLSYFEPVVHFPGFARALAATLAELRLANIDAAALEALDAPGPELARLLSALDAQLRAARVADRAVLLDAALVAARAHTPPVGSPLLLFDIAADSQAERHLLNALIDAAPEALATLPSGDQQSRSFYVALGGSVTSVGTEDSQGSSRSPQTDDAVRTQSSLQRLRQYLFDAADPPPGNGDDTVTFFSAPGEQRECVEIARWLLREAERGVRFDDMAVFLRAPQQYTLALEHALQRARIPAFFATGLQRPDPAGRAFVALLQCKADGLSARRFAEYLSLAQVPGGEPEAGSPGLGAEQQRSGNGAETQAAVAPPDGDAAVLAGTLQAPWRWEEMLVEAAVIGGKQRWQRRLDGLAAQLQARLAEAENEDPDGSQVLALRREVAQLGHLRSFALPVIEALAMLPHAASWGEWLAALTGLAAIVLRRPERVVNTLAELQPMAEVGPVGIGEVLAVLADRLLELEHEVPASRFGGVFVAAPEEARGRIFRVVCVPGLAERIFPQRPREDPLLIDALRERLGGSLATQATRAERERLRLRLAVGAASERLYLSYPRVEVVEGRARVPSFYGLDVERAISGEIPDFEALERRTAAIGESRLAWPAPPDAARAIDDIEHDLASLGALLHQTNDDPRGRARYLLELNACLGRSLRSRWSRWETRKWTPADGLMRCTDHTRDWFETQRLRNRPYGVSALQRFSACPYQFYLAAILGLAPRQMPAALERIDPLTKGRLVHAIQAALLRALHDDGALPITVESLGAALPVLDAVIDAVSEQYRDDLAPAIARVWHDEVEAIRTDLHVWLERLGAGAAEWQPAHFELGFGLASRAALDPGSVREPVRVLGDFQLRGAVDLIERNPPGTALRVTDYKTGTDRTPADFIVGGGAVLQPVLYSLAVEAVLGLPVTDARLSFCTSAGGFTDRSLRIDTTARQSARQLLDTIDRAIETGMLAPAPRCERRNGREEAACDLCDFREVCGPHEPLRVRGKDPALLAALLKLRSLT